MTAATIPGALGDRLAPLFDAVEGLLAGWEFAPGVDEVGAPVMAQAHPDLVIAVEDAYDDLVAWLLGADAEGSLAGLAANDAEVSP